MNSLVSVIVPIYNMEKYIKACVNSIVTQSYNNLEIILVNDGSKDTSSIICEQIAKNNPNVLLINQENQGVSLARNNGIEHARGEYLLFVDADDTVPPDAIRTMVEAAEAHNADLIIGKASKNEDIPIGVFTGESFLRKVLEDNPMAYSVWRILFKREFVQNLRFPEGYIAHEDSYFVFLCALKKPKVLTINKVVYNYTIVNNSASRSGFTTKKYDDICQLLEKKEKIIIKDYKHLIPLYYHLKCKIQMALLSNLILTKGEEFRKKEKETLIRFNEAKKYFHAELPYSNASFYNILSKNMYYPYKMIMKLKRAVKCMLQM